ncbi:unnamed protein product [Hermetia illucens]|uniref:Autophagy-related protein n=1 Tax=Hermetia illucens TaxID=343691 RepID=A0A7R8V5P0_HERIL|nr:microtubule-associated proteins 1A/1B light chain 3B-like [Hermetia illucens]CAD7093361.1 unnamed protein product [Hermetia illucens]
MMNSIDCYNTFIKTKHGKRDVNANNFNSLYATSDKGYQKTDEACAIRLRFPTKIPIIVDRYAREYELPYLNKRKFLVPQEITMAQFLLIIRNRLNISHNKALFLLVNNRTLVPMSKSITEVYEQHRSDDGFLYMTYTSQEVFG